ncbi:MAG: flavodoxin-dependent (E)-4-hydroxy-3-methylbut-2-enyl-diphosphate synthase [Candidatus Delongbacteria bacterium]|nr:flavodoxin-dependent (E)-4-hydroxy-3-methylbut-2-enyl-diphosphate synthase [Candidatus Delongbacteria bacterium]
MDQIERRPTRTVRIGSQTIGGNHPILIQSMTNTLTRDIRATLGQIHQLEEEGCEIIRVAVPTAEDAVALSLIKKEISIPLIADIHFDHHLAILAIENGADKIRINPGNIGSRDKVDRVIETARDHGVSIRIGVNSGSLEKDLLERYGHPTAEAMVESVLRWVDYFESRNFNQIVLAVKSSQVVSNFRAYRILSSRTDYPLHIGVTESGIESEGMIKSAAGLGSLLMNGIGDTIRISLTGDPLPEVQTAKLLLQSLGLRYFQPEIISCPTCGRCRIKLEELVQQVRHRIRHIRRPMVIAIMGCAVNGPGEAREADLGIAGGREDGLIFQKGKIIARLQYDQLADELVAMIEKLDREPS